MEYRKRIADELLELQLEAAGIAIIDGAKWCGKTTTALQQAKSTIFMDNPEHMQDYKRLAETNVNTLLEGDNPRLIDEGAKNLNLLAKKIDTDKMYAPSFLMVLTGVGQCAYQRKEDGVYVVPIGCLKP